MSGTADDEALFRARTEQMSLSQTEVGVTLRASAAPDTIKDVDPAELPRITIDTHGGGTMPLERVNRPDLAVLATIGEGGMGRVHLARQRSLAREVAVKTLKEGATPAVAHALLREARVTGMLEHPGVIPVHALGVDDEGHPMLVMKRVDGVDLATQLRGEAQTGERLVACLEALIQVCRTCEFAHSRGVLHRDIKPENIMVGGFGEVYLLDWGIATKLDAQGAGDETIVGTPVYMAPEMVLGRALDVRTDVYLLGATLHEILTGRPRHGGKSMMEVARAAMFSEPVAYGQDVPEELATLCNRATARDPAQRPPSAEAFREGLSAFLRHRSARSIADAALARVAEVETLLAATEGVPADLARAYRLAAEARFGLTQSLRDDDGAVATREGMRRCIVAAVEIELRQDHVDSAAALIRDLAEPEPDLERRIAERREAVRARDERLVQLASLQRDLDPSHKARQRTLPMVAIVTVLICAASFVATRGPALTPWSVLAAGLVALVVMAGGLAAVRSRLLTNAFNRRLAALLVLGTLAVFLNRVVALVVARPPARTLSEDLMLLAAVMASAAVTLVRGLWISAALFFVGYLAAEVWPELTAGVFTVTAMVSLATGAVILRRARPGDA